jgi:hypothetical protein
MGFARPGHPGLGWDIGELFWFDDRAEVMRETAERAIMSAQRTILPPATALPGDRPGEALVTPLRKRTLRWCPLSIEEYRFPPRNAALDERRYPLDLLAHALQG